MTTATKEPSEEFMTALKELKTILLHQSHDWELVEKQYKDLNPYYNKPRKKDSGKK